jgi:hypothetical protein
MPFNHQNTIIKNIQRDTKRINIYIYRQLADENSGPHRAGLVEFKFGKGQLGKLHAHRFLRLRDTITDEHCQGAFVEFKLYSLKIVLYT